MEDDVEGSIPFLPIKFNRRVGVFWLRLVGGNAFRIRFLQFAALLASLFLSCPANHGPDLQPHFIISPLWIINPIG